MDWLPKWLGRAYAKLYEDFGENAFTLPEAGESLGPASNVRVILSSLVKAGWALRADHGRYVVLGPMLAVARLGGELLGGSAVKTYLPIISSFTSSALRRIGSNLVSVAVYGSVAAGRPLPSSDIDILLIAKGLPPRYSQRASMVAGLIRGTERLRMEIWRRKGMYPDLDVIALTPEEASVAQPIYLEMLEASLFVVDREGFLDNRLQAFARRLAEQGARKVQTPEGLTYWILSPASKAGEVVEI